MASGAMRNHRDGYRTRQTQQEEHLKDQRIVSLEKAQEGPMADVKITDGLSCRRDGFCRISRYQA